MDHTLLVPCLDILASTLLWEHQAQQVVATGTIPLKVDLAWLLKVTVRCLAMAGVFQAVLVDTAAVIRCKVAMAALQVLVDILLMVKLATTAATRVNTLTSCDRTVQPGGPL